MRKSLRAVNLRAANIWLLTGWFCLTIAGLAIWTPQNHGFISLSNSVVESPTEFVAADIATIKPPKKMLVIGDSYTTGPEAAGRQHNDIVGSERRGWWSFLADDLGYAAVLSAQPGSGMLKGGLTCLGTTYGERIGAIAKVKPDLLLIEGGRNDFTYCDSQTSAKSGRNVTTYSVHVASSEAITVATRKYLKQVRDEVDKIGLPPDRVYVFAPWGRAIMDKWSMITGIIEKQAKAEGFTYIEVPPFTNADLYDDTHPNGQGSEDLYQELLAKSNLSSYRTK